MEMTEEVCVDPSLQAPKNPNPDMEQLADNAKDMMGDSLGGLRSSGQKELAALQGIPLKRVTQSKVKGMFGGKGSDVSEEAAERRNGRDGGRAAGEAPGVSASGTAAE